MSIIRICFQWKWKGVEHEEFKNSPPIWQTPFQTGFDVLFDFHTEHIFFIMINQAIKNLKITIM